MALTVYLWCRTGVHVCESACETGAVCVLSGTIRAAGLDVCYPEPLPAAHPLLQLPNCVVLPHIASASESTRSKMAVMAVDNLLAGVEGRALPTQV